MYVGVGSSNKNVLKYKPLASFKNKETNKMEFIRECDKKIKSYFMHC